MRSLVAAIAREPICRNSVACRLGNWGENFIFRLSSCNRYTTYFVIGRGYALRGITPRIHSA